jgi:predicted NBD/HSP70 family sugar kinase
MTPAPAPRGSARRRTQAAILARLQGGDHPTRADLARELGYSASTISAAVEELVAEGRVEHAPARARAGPGRPGAALRLRLAGTLLGVEFDHDRVHVVVADGDGTAVADGDRPVDTTADPAAAIGAAAAQARVVLERAGRGPGDILAVGVGLPAPVDVRTGVVGSSSVLPHWQHVNVADAFRGRLGPAPVHVDNDANLAAQALATLDASFVYVKASTGLGAALCVEGQVLRGRHGAAGELGHVTVPGEDLPCHCGGRGCLETLCATPALLRRLAAVGVHADDLDGVRQRRRQHPSVVNTVLFDMGARLGIHLAHVCTVLDLDRAVIGGELADLAPAYIDGARATARRWVHPQLAPRLEVSRSPLGAGASLAGALVAARRLASRLTGT